ncbi:hypothetical protein [Micromonospora sp. NPDC005173]|uniref:hypothetical protein n=1 Tax=Micromonospora sp. NPDC005173 TaxID=3157165 RepID=UPI0033BD635D
MTGRRNRVAVVTDGTAVLGLGDVGPAAALAVMEGKAALFVHLAGIDAVPVCLGTKHPDEFVAAVRALAPSFGGIDLEAIAAPACFEVERRLQEALDIPVFHDDQHGTAIVVLAALRNALRVVGKRVESARLVVVGAARRVRRRRGCWWRAAPPMWWWSSGAGCCTATTCPGCRRTRHGWPN